MKKKILLFTLLALAVSACKCGNEPKAVVAEPEGNKAPESVITPSSPLNPHRPLTEEQKEKVEAIGRKLNEKVDSILNKALEEGKIDSAQLEQLKKMAAAE